MEVARYWRTTKQRYRLIGEADAKTGQKRLSLHGGAATPTQFCGRGEVYSFTTIHAPPEGFEKFAPYLVALVRLEEGPLVTAQLTDVDVADVKIGMPVEMVTRVIREDGADGRGMMVYGYKFRPAWPHKSGTDLAAVEQNHWKYPVQSAIVTNLIAQPA